ncbi:MAG TPA: hypothetical protein VFQ72_02215 [Candidatus Paceibacterota bacterium]|nr:hypothetical protein [Candidatus Paceibacterota bacterium]
MYIRTSYKASLVIALAAAVALAAAWGFIAYRSSVLRDQIVGLEEKAAAALARGQRAQEARAALRETGAAIRSVDARFLSKDDIPGFISLVESQGAAAGVKADVGSIDLDEKGDLSELKTLRLRLTAKGAWKDCVAYAAALEDLPYAVQVDALALSKAAGAAGVWNMTVEMTALVDLQRTDETI